MVRATRGLLIAVVTGLAAVRMYEYAAGPGDQPDGITVLAALIGVACAATCEAIWLLIKRISK